jgi:hypothetical protein
MLAKELTRCRSSRYPAICAGMFQPTEVLGSPSLANQSYFPQKALDMGVAQVNGDSLLDADERGGTRRMENLEHYPVPTRAALNNTEAAAPGCVPAHLGLALSGRGFSTTSK